jgi:hypothetical protein
VMQNGTNVVSTVNYTGDPNNNVAANPSSLSHDPISGFLWLKIDQTDTLHWQRLFPSPTPPILSVLTANATPQFALAGTTATLDFNLTNLALGSSLPAITVGTQNVAMGSGALKSVTSGSTNVCVGFNAATALTSGTNNVAIGQNSLITSTNTVGCVGVGEGTLTTITSGQYNTAIGFAVLNGINTGTQNIGIGKNAGDNYNGSESSNIVIGNQGVLGESNVTRIGQIISGGIGQTSCYVAGITGVTVAGSAPVGVASTGQLSSLGFGTATQVLTSNGAATSPTWQPVSSSGAVITLTGNTGGAIPPDGTGTINVITANSTPKFVGSGNTLTQDFNLTNLLLGSNGSSITTAAENVAVGAQALQANISGTDNTAIGYNALFSDTNGSANTALGARCLPFLVSGADNTAAGFQSLLNCIMGSRNSSFGSRALENATGDDNSGFGESSMFGMSTGTQNTGCGARTLHEVLTGNYNCALGFAALELMTGGSNNISIGQGSSSNYSSNESSNIIIGNAGTSLESNTIRVGTQGTSAGQQNQTFVAGITGVTAVGSPVAVSATGQLSDLGFGTTTYVLTSNGAGVSPTWQPILPAGFPWLDASGVFTAAINTGYFLTAASTPTLPSAPARGDIIEFFVDANALCTITANTGQVINYASSTSASAGTLAASVKGDSVRLVYRDTDTSWNTIGSMGASWTVT